MNSFTSILDAALLFMQANPIPSAVIGMMVVAIVIAVVKKLFKLALGLSVIIIAAAILLHYFGHDTLPQQGKDLLEDAEEYIEEKM